MATLLVLLILILTIAFAVVIPRGLPGVSTGLYVGLSWIPAAALGLEYVFADALLRVLSYGVILVPLFTCLASIFLGILGLVLFARLPGGSGQSKTLAGATILAGGPGLLLLGYVVYGATL